MMTGTSSTPCASCTEPNVNRRSAEIESIPTVPRARPRATITKALRIEPPDSRDRSRRPASVIAKYSGGPNWMATSASQLAASMMPITPTVPATNDPTAATVRAAPARPFRVIW